MRAILIVDHGSRRDASNRQLAELAAVVQAHAPELCVGAAHMELAAPSVAQGMAQLVAQGATDVVVVPYMLAPGRHVTEDIPRLAREAARAHPSVRVSVSPCLGVHALLAQLVVERVAEAKPLADGAGTGA